MLKNCQTPFCLKNPILTGSELCEKCDDDLYRGKAARYREDFNHPEYNKGGEFYKKMCKITHKNPRYSTPTKTTYTKNVKTDSDTGELLITLIGGFSILITALFLSGNNKRK